MLIEACERAMIVLPTTLKWLLLEFFHGTLTSGIMTLALIWRTSCQFH